MKFTFRGISIESDFKNEKISLDFNGHYLIEIDENLIPTGNAIDGYGTPISFNQDELIIEDNQ